jgi:hypothetical protein
MRAVIWIVLVLMDGQPALVGNTPLFVDRPSCELFVATWQPDPKSRTWFCQPAFIQKGSNSI